MKVNLRRAKYFAGPGRTAPSTVRAPLTLNLAPVAVNQPGKRFLLRNAQLTRPFANAQVDCRSAGQSAAKDAVRLLASAV